MTSDFRFTVRRILHNKLSTLINAIGLTIGIFVALVLANYYVQESSYDLHHANGDRIFQAISRVEFNQGRATTMSISFGTLAESFRSNFPFVENTARLFGPRAVDVDLTDQRFTDVDLLRLDYSFFELFDYAGFDPSSFQLPNDAIMSREAAERMFGGEAIGKQITVENETYTIRGVADIPKNTVYRFDVALPVVGMPYFDEMENGGLEFETYVLLKEGAISDRAVVDLGLHYDQMMEEKWPKYEAANFLLPLEELYLNKAGVSTRMGNGDRDQLTIIISIALVVLALALINYMNLQIASNHGRAIETRIKKILGAGKGHLVKQGVAEALLVIGLASILAIVLLDLFYQSSFSQLFGAEPYGIQDWDTLNFVYLAAAIIGIGVSAGIVPSFKLFRRTVVTQQMISDKRLSKFTVGLVVFQFFVTSALLISIMFVNLQMDFIRNQPKGYDSEQVVVIDNLGDPHQEKYDLIKAELERQANILSVGGAQSAPGRGASGQFIHRRDKSEDDGIDVAHIRTLEGYAATLGLEFVEGGDFTITTPGQDYEFILNQMAARRLFAEGEPIVGQTVNMGDRVGPIVGVVKDFHYRSFKHKMSPLVLNVEEPYRPTLIAKISSDNIEESLSTISSVLSTIDPLYVFDYHFLDDQFERSYRAEIRMGKVITYATVVAFSISIMGLLSLSLFVINARLKEIAIRKTLGGGQWHIFSRLSSQLVVWIIIGNVLAIPVVYWLAQRWVQDFIYQVSLTHLFWMTVTSAGLTLVAGMVVILRKLHNTMTMNPVEFLRSE